VWGNIRARRPADDYPTSDTAQLSCLHSVTPPCGDHNHAGGKEKLVDILNQVTFYEGPSADVSVRHWELAF